VNDLREPLAALGLTVLVEFVVLSLIQRRAWGRVLLAAVLVNGCTEPLASLIYRSGTVPWIAIEAAVILVEWPLYRLLLPVGRGRAFVLALLANTASALVGVLVYGR
jgi:hypothetical protein